MKRSVRPNEKTIVYPYIPNSVPSVKRQMLKEVGAASAEEFFDDIPGQLRLRGEMDLPKPFLSECALKRHVEGIISRNKDCKE